MSAANILRDALFGNPPSQTVEPSREGVLAAFRDLEFRADKAIAAAVAGIVYYATAAERIADTSKPVGTIGKAADEADYYRRAASGWVVDNTVYQGVAAVLKPDLDALEDQVDQSLAVTGVVTGAAVGAPINDNVNALSASVPGFADNTPFDLLILKTNTGPVLLTVGSRTARIANGGSVDYEAGTLIAGNVYTISYSPGGGKFVVTGAPRSVRLTRDDIGAGITTLSDQPWGTIGANNSVTTTQVIITDCGSSVFTDNPAKEGGAPVGYAPLDVLCGFLNDGWPLDGVQFVADKQARGGQVMSQFIDQQLKNSTAWTNGSSRFVLVGGGMNDFQVSSYNAGQAMASVRAITIGIIEANRAKGIKTLLCPSPHPRTTVYDYASFYSSNPGIGQAYPRVIPGPVNPETGQYPPASQSKGQRDMTGGGKLSEYDLRFWHGNRVLREVSRAYPNDVIVLDAEWAWFRYGVEVSGVDSLYASGEQVHPNILGHQVSFGRVFRQFASDLTAGRLLKRIYLGDA